MASLPVTMAGPGSIAARRGPAPFTDSSSAASLRSGRLTCCPAKSAVCRRPGLTTICGSVSDDPPRQSGNSVAEFVRNCALSLAVTASVALPLALAPPELMPRAEAGLQASDPIKNARALLRNALPVNNKPIRDIQNQLEGISAQLRIPGNKSLGPIEGAVRRAQGILNSKKAQLEADFAPDKKEAGLKAIADLDASLKAFSELTDKQEVPASQQRCLAAVGQIEEAMVKGFPFEVPAEYANLPQLKGRAVVDMKVNLKTKRENGVTGGIMRIVVDGYNAPVTAGDFLDLVRRGFYDGMDIQRADGFVVQTGKPAGKEEGFVDSNGEIRRIPFEVMVAGDKKPVYEETLEDNGRFNENVALPFNAYGTLALARAEFDANSGSSQIFFLLKESELTPTGSNLLDGRYAVFGYIVDNSELLADLQVGDKIEYAKVISGLENLQDPKAA